MKNVFKLFGIIAMVAAIGFSMAACDDGAGSPGGGGGGGGGTFTLTDIPSKYNGMYVMFGGSNEDAKLSLSGYEVRVDGTGNGTLPRISGGRVSIPMWRNNPDYKGPNSGTSLYVRYSGNETADFGGFITAASTVSEASNSSSPNAGYKAIVLFYSVRFSNGSATISWNKADQVGEY
jgi:hypothetical protein